MTSPTRRLGAYSCALLILLPLMIGGAATSRAQSSRNGRQSTLVLRVYFRDAAERDRLATELSAEEASTLGGYLTVVADGATYDRLTARGLRVEVDQALTAEVDNFSLTAKSNSGSSSVSYSKLKTQAPQTFFGGYLTLAGVENYLDQIVAAYPNLAEKVDIGDSWCKTHLGQCTQPYTWNGYDLWALHITNRSIPGPKPLFWLDAGIHAREIATPEIATRFISYLLDGYNTDADARWLVDQQDIWVLPIFNPDGRLIVESGTDAGMPYFQRKNANRSNGCTLYPPRDFVQFGTDLNRNFPFKWGCCNGSTLTACDQTYRGPSQNSEEETQAVTAKIRQLAPDQRGPTDTDAAPITATGVYQNLHSFADLNLYPWGWGQQPAPNGLDLKNIAAHASDQGAGGNGYKYCQSPDCLYAADGTAGDWGYGELGMATVTTELSGGRFFPPYSEVADMWEKNKGMLIYLAKMARTPFLTTRGPDANNVAASLNPVLQGAPGQVTATINYAWTGNAYTQNVAGAEYYIDTPPWAGGTAIPMASADGSLDSPTEAVAAAVETVNLAPGRHIIYVRGRGVNDYEGLQSWGPVSATWLVVALPDPDLQVAGVSRRSNGTRPGR